MMTIPVLKSDLSWIYFLGGTALLSMYVPVIFHDPHGQQEIGTAPILTDTMYETASRIAIALCFPMTVELIMNYLFAPAPPDEAPPIVPSISRQVKLSMKAFTVVMFLVPNLLIYSLCVVDKVGGVKEIFLALVYNQFVLVAYALVLALNYYNSAFYTASWVYLIFTVSFFNRLSILVFFLTDWPFLTIVSLALRIVLMITCPPLMLYWFYANRHVIVHVFQLQKDPEWTSPPLSKEQVLLVFYVIMFFLFAIAFVVGTLLGAETLVGGRMLIFTQVLLISALGLLPGRLARMDERTSDRNLENRKSFVQYISHESRGPLQVAIMGLELHMQDMIDLDKSGLSVATGVNAARVSSTGTGTGSIVQQVGRLGVRSFPSASASGIGSVNGIVSGGGASGGIDDPRHAKWIAALNDQVQNVVEVVAACSLAQQTLSDMLTFDKIQSGMMEMDKTVIPVFPFVGSVCRAFAIQARYKHIELVFDWTASLDSKYEAMSVMADRPKLSQALRNILSNALKFTPDGGKILCTVRVMRKIVRSLRDDITRTGTGGEFSLSRNNSNSTSVVQSVSRRFVEVPNSNSNSVVSPAPGAGNSSGNNLSGGSYYSDPMSGQGSASPALRLSTQIIQPLSLTQGQFQTGSQRSQSHSHSATSGSHSQQQQQQSQYQQAMNMASNYSGHSDVAKARFEDVSRPDNTENTNTNTNTERNHRQETQLGHLYCRIEVQDGGPGISSANMSRLFGKFVQFDPSKLQQGGGSGLGLWLTRSIMEQHSGGIGAVSEGVEGRGSTFFIDIPVYSLKKLDENGCFLPELPVLSRLDEVSLVPPRIRGLLLRQESSASQDSRLDGSKVDSSILQAPSQQSGHSGSFSGSSHRYGIFGLLGEAPLTSAPDNNSSSWNNQEVSHCQWTEWEAQQDRQNVTLAQTIMIGRQLDATKGGNYNPSGAVSRSPDPDGSSSYSNSRSPRSSSRSHTTSCQNSNSRRSHAKSHNSGKSGSSKANNKDNKECSSNASSVRSGLTATSAEMLPVQTISNNNVDAGDHLLVSAQFNGLNSTIRKSTEVGKLKRSNSNNNNSRNGSPVQPQPKPQPQSQSQSQSQSQLESFPIIRIMIVDDMGSNRKVLTRAVQKLDPEIICVEYTDGNEAVDAIAASLPARPDTAAITAAKAIANAVAAARAVAVNNALPSTAPVPAESNIFIVPADVDADTDTPNPNPNSDTDPDNQNMYYDIIFIDCQMTTMDGPPAVELIRQKYGYSGLIYGVTGDPRCLERFKAAGADATFEKPMKRQNLEDIINAYKKTLSLVSSEHGHKPGTAAAGGGGTAGGSGAVAADGTGTAIGTFSPSTGGDNSSSIQLSVPVISALSTGSSAVSTGDVVK